MTTPAPTTSVRALLERLCAAVDTLFPAIEAKAKGPHAPYRLYEEGIEQIVFSCPIALFVDQPATCIAYDHHLIPDSAHHSLARAAAMGEVEQAAEDLSNALAVTAPVLLEQDLSIALVVSLYRTRWTVENEEGPLLTRPTTRSFVEAVDMLAQAVAGIPPGDASLPFRCPSHTGGREWTVYAGAPVDALRVAMAYDLVYQPATTPEIRTMAIEQHSMRGHNLQALQAHQLHLSALMGQR